ncbi:MAG: flagellar type III secretion system pore protein FliP [Peptococcaceae bacterium]|nr:flagellar type III secretion system pore protein FliP [Peptococcaceae bacterium]
MRFNWVALCCLGIFFALVPAAYAQPLPIPGIDINIGEAGSPGEVVNSVKLLILLTVIALLPAFIIMVTSFTRIVVVLSLLRTALGTHNAPPNQVLIGLALFLTIFIMAPVYEQINDQAIQPFLRNEIDQEQAQEAAAAPLREFMLKQTREKDLNLFIRLAEIENPQRDSLPLTVVTPAFMISELKTAFQMGFMLYLPFVIIDMVVASILMSLGMFMLPPVMISLPFKILLFILVDGWYLVVKSLVESFA